MRRWQGSLAVLVAAFVTVGADLALSASECLSAGFVPSTLLCSTCDELPNYNLEQMLTDCKQCCTQDKTQEQEKFPVAIIEVCDCNLGRFPQVQAFVRSSLVDQWGSAVRVKQVRGVRPTIVLKDASGQTRQTLNIEKWDTDTITEFLNARLI